MFYLNGFQFETVYMYTRYLESTQISGFFLEIRSELTGHEASVHVRQDNIKVCRSHTDVSSQLVSAVIAEYRSNSVSLYKLYKKFTTSRHIEMLCNKSSLTTSLQQIEKLSNKSATFHKMLQLVVQQIHDKSNKWSLAEYFIQVMSMRSSNVG